MAAPGLSPGLLALLLAPAVLSTSCVLTADEYLAVVEATRDASVDAEGDAGPTTWSLRVVDRVALPVVEPRGLAVDADAVWTTEATTRQLLRIEEGEVAAEIPLPAAGVVDLAVKDGVLYVGYPDATWRLEGDAFVEVAAHDQLTGLSATPDGVVTHERDGLHLRSGPRLATELVLDAPEGTRVARADAGYLLYGGRPAGNAVRFPAALTLADASSRAIAEPLAELLADVDVWPVVGLDAAGDRVWLLGAGYGEDAGTLVELALERAP